MQLTIGIDASRCRSGGAVAHIVGLVGAAEPRQQGVARVHLWAPDIVLERVEERPWLVKHACAALAGGVSRQLWWQATALEREARALDCDVVFAADAATLCRFEPLVVLSQDLLAYEPGVRQRFGIGTARARLEALRIIQDAAFRRAAGVIFLTEYAAWLIQRECGTLPRTKVIPHSVSHDGLPSRRTERRDNRQLCVYVSPIWQFKNQWVVVEAVAQLRNRGLNVVLRLIGGANQAGAKRLETALRKFDPMRSFVEVTGHVDAAQIGPAIAAADIFVFASVCENLPVTLLEAMAAGVPIVCSDRGPMPEVLGDGGLYFDPDDPLSIANAIQMVLDDPEAARHRSMTAKGSVQSETWASVASKTFGFIRSCVEEET